MKLYAVTAVKCQKTGELIDTSKCKFCDDVIKLYHDWDEYENIISAVYCSHGDINKGVTE